MSWSQATRDRWFYYALAASTVSVAWLFWPYLDVLVFATVTATVAYPLQERTEDLLTRWGPMSRLFGAIGGVQVYAAIVVTLMLAAGLFAPLTLILIQFVQEAIHLVEVGMEWVGSGRLDTLMADVRASLDPEQLPDWMEDRLPETLDPGAGLVEPLRQAASTGLGALSNALPSVLASLMSGLIDGILFVLTVVTLLAEGPRILAFVIRLSPLDDDYERRLADVFREFAGNMVVGSLATAVAQGIVATLGFWWVGMPRPLFFGVLTAVGSFVPVVGTAVIVVPAVLWAWNAQGVATAFGLLVYAVVVIGSVDNLLRPLFMRGSSAIHPLLIFLAVFGGMAWMGVTGVLVGPVLVAVFLALTRIRDEMDDAIALSPAPAGSGDEA